MSRVIALVDDLLFLSRTREAARGTAAEARAVRDATSLTESVRDGGRLVLVAADSSRLTWEAAVRALRATAGDAVPGTPALHARSLATVRRLDRLPSHRAS